VVFGLYNSFSAATRGNLLDNYEESKSRPGRRIAAEKRRIARRILREFYKTPEFEKLPGAIQLAMKEVCPVRDSHPVKDDAHFASRITWDVEMEQFAENLGLS
jgi:hypothetical protein